jgi:hypothetical protein
MHGDEKSDLSIVAGKPASMAVEWRAYRTPDRFSVPSDGMSYRWLLIIERASRLAAKLEGVGPQS